MVYDHYRDKFPDPSKIYFTEPSGPAGPERILTIPPSDLDRLDKLVKEFREAIASAEKLDALLKQKDCADPEKAKLEERVARLEKLLAQRKKRK